jgi:hypothetical protein
MRLFLSALLGASLAFALTTGAIAQTAVPLNQFPNAATLSGSDKTLIERGTPLPYLTPLSTLESWIQQTLFGSAVTMGGAKYEPACTGIAVHDDPIVTDAFAWASANASRAILSGGTCMFTTPVAVGAASNWSVTGQGPAATILLYAADLIALGNTSAQSVNVTLADFLIRSNTTMTGGAGLHLIQVLQSRLDNITADGQYGNGNLYHGVWFDAVDNVIWDGVNSRAQQDAVRIDGTPSGGQSDLYLMNGKVSQSAVGIHQGGGFGGLYVDGIDDIANTTNFLYDNSINSNPNYQVVFAPNSYMDTAGGNGAVINETVAGTNGYQLMFLGWIASSASNGLWIEKCQNCWLDINGNMITGNQQDGVRVDDTSIIADIGGVIRNNAQTSGWGVDCTAAMSLYLHTMVHDNGRGGVHYEVNPACTQLGVNTYSAKPANPAATTSTSGVMMGLAGSFTPKFSGVVRLSLCGQAQNNTAGDGALAQLYYGTGAAPANGAAVAGTPVGQGTTVTSGMANAFGSFCTGTIVAGLTPWTTYWLDGSQYALVGGTATISNPVITAEEIH